MVVVLRAVVWVVVVGLAALSAATVQDSAGEVTRDVQVFRFNEFLGDQRRQTGVHGALALLPSCDDVQGLNCSLVAGRVALCPTTSSLFFRWRQEEQSLHALQECGAVAVVKAWRVPAKYYGNAPLVGLQYHLRDDDCCRGSGRVSIPVLVARHSDLWPAMAALQQNQSAVVTLRVDEVDVSDWEHLFSSLLFLALHRMAIPALSAVPLVTAVRALILHHGNWTELKRKRGSNNKARSYRTVRSIALIAAALCAYALGSVVRLVYAVWGPVWSSGAFTLTQHRYLGLPGVAVWVQVLAAALSACVLRQWGRIKHQSRHNIFFNQRFETLVVALALALVGGVVCGVEGLQRRGLSRPVAFLWVERGACVALLLVSAAVLLVFKARFNAKLKRSKILRPREHACGTYRRSSLESRRRKTASLMSCSILALLVELIALGLGFVPSVLYHPLGWTLVWFVFHAMALVSAQFQCLAFTPRNTTHPRLGAFNPLRRGSMDSEASLSEVESIGSAFGSTRRMDGSRRSSDRVRRHNTEGAQPPRVFEAAVTPKRPPPRRSHTSGSARGSQNPTTRKLKTDQDSDSHGDEHPVGVELPRLAPQGSNGKALHPPTEGAAGEGGGVTDGVGKPLAGGSRLLVPAVDLDPASGGDGDDEDAQ